MQRRSARSLSESELPTFDDDSALFDPSPECSFPVAGTPARRRRSPAPCSRNESGREDLKSQSSMAAFHARSA
jgi:hypothetical protein